MRRRRRYTPDPYATAMPARRMVHAAMPGTCPKCLTDYPAGTAVIRGRHGWQHGTCDERDDQ